MPVDRRDRRRQLFALEADQAGRLAAAGVDQEQLGQAIGDAAGRGLLAIRRPRARAAVGDPRAALRIERALPHAEASGKLPWAAVPFQAGCYSEAV